MAGGSGTRFWPESRRARPKQLLPVMGKEALIVETANRLQPIIAREQIWVVTNHAQAEGVRQAMPWLKEEQLLIEPCARNTAACVALAATAIGLQDSEAICLFMPADHVIGPAEEFHRSLEAAQQAALQAGALVTFGIRPAFPATGYGYIRRAGSILAGGIDLPAWAIDSFTEKPDRATAEKFLEDGTYFWNSGMFAWRVDTILSAIGKYMPKLAEGMAKIRADFCKERIAEVYSNLESIPIDVGVMEKASGGIVIEAPFNWSDIGSWKSLYDELDKDDLGNVSVLPQGGELLVEGASNVLAYSNDKQLIAVVGLDDVVVVRTDDAILVCHRDRAEDVKAIVDKLHDSGHEELL